MKRIVIIGSTSLIAQHCARIWAKEPIELTSIARNKEKATLLEYDLKVRSPESKIKTIILDFMDPRAIEDISSKLSIKPIDIVLIAHGHLLDQANEEPDIETCKNNLMINGVSPCLFAEAFTQRMLKLNHGTLAIISSVAGERGRKSNYIYGSGKSMLTHFAEGLQHLVAQTGVHVTLIKPGPTKTPMTLNHGKPQAAMATPEEVATGIVQAVKDRKNTVYLPKRWFWIMLIIRAMPQILFNKINI